MAPPKPRDVLMAYRHVFEAKAQAPPLLQINLDGRGPGRVVPLDMAPHPREALEVIVDGMRHRQLPRLAWVAFCADSYTVIAGQFQGDMGLVAEDRHALSRMYAERVPGVVECLMAQMMHRDGSFWGAQWIYHRLPALADKVLFEPEPDVFSEREDTAASPEGPIPQLLWELVGVDPE